MCPCARACMHVRAPWPGCARPGVLLEQLRVRMHWPLLSDPTFALTHSLHRSWYIKDKFTPKENTANGYFKCAHDNLFALSSRVWHMAFRCPCSKCILEVSRSGQEKVGPGSASLTTSEPLSHDAINQARIVRHCMAPLFHGQIR